MVGELVALLSNAMLPLVFPALCGAKVIVKGTLCPARHHHRNADPAKRISLTLPSRRERTEYRRRLPLTSPFGSRCCLQARFQNSWWKAPLRADRPPNRRPVAVPLPVNVSVVGESVALLLKAMLPLVFPGTLRSKGDREGDTLSGWHHHRKADSAKRISLTLPSRRGNRNIGATCS